jgi:putative ABC transport system permease protein
MKLNSLKIAWRSLKKHPFFTFLNMLGLSIGMAGALLICLYISDELSFDRMFVDSDRIYRVNADIKFGGQAQEFATTPAPMASTLKKDYPQVNDATRFRTWGSMLLRKSNSTENLKEEQSTFADANFMEFFGINLLEGDVKTALRDPQTVVISKTAAEKYFGKTSALGQSILINNEETFKITGVIDDLPKNSFLRNYSVFMAMEGFKDAKDYANWGSNNFNTFIKVNEGITAADLNAPLNQLFEKYIVPFAQAIMPGVTRKSFEAEGNYIKYHLTALNDLHLSSNRVAEISTNSDKQTVYIFSFIALFLIVLASVNFMNLSTAQSLKRAKEVGIRKTLGSDKFGLIVQFLTESGLLTFLSLGLALIFALLAMPFFNQLSGKDISIPFLNPIFWLTLFVSTIFLGLLSGSYPAFFLSRFVPIKVLKSAGVNSIGSSRIRNSLVVFQFSISVFLMMSTFVVYQQLQYIQNKDLGYSKEQLLVIDDVYAAGNQVESFKQEILNLPNVSSATLSSFLPTPSNRSDNGYKLEGSSEQDKTVQMQTWSVDHDYGKTLDLEIIAGRDFDKQFMTDSSGIVLNETAVGILGFTPQEAIGKRLSNALDDEKGEFFTIIGVAKNFHYTSFKDEIGAWSMHLGKTANKLTIKLQPGDFKQTLESVKLAWTKVAPGQPFNHYFLDDSFNSTYDTEQRLGKLFITFTILSIIIACLGLFGLAAFNAEKRVKEIGVRKVMGASVSQITIRLSADFLKLVGIAILFSLPIGWYAMNKWLEDFTYRINIAWWVYVSAAGIAILIAVLTVSYQSIKAAIVNPVESLRGE